jgi:hypothetical protein
MNNKLKIIVTGALLLVATLISGAPAIAGVVGVAVGGHTFENVSAANVEVRNVSGGNTRIQTTGLNGRFDTTPGGTGAQGSFIAVTQDQNLLFDPDTGTINGDARGQLTFSAEGIQLNYQGNISGIASCMAGEKRACSQYVVNVTLEAVVADPNNPQRVAVLRMELLGSLVRDDQGTRWSVFDDNATVFGSSDINILTLTSMGEGESCGV